jgi:hypothetical protein
MAQKRKATKSASSKTKKETFKSKKVAPRKNPSKMDEKKMEVLTKGLDKLNKNFKCLIGDCEKALNTLLDSNNNQETQLQTR